MIWPVPPEVLFGANFLGMFLWIIAYAFTKDRHQGEGVPCDKPGGRHDWEPWGEPYRSHRSSVFIRQTRKCLKCNKLEERVF